MSRKVFLVLVLFLFVVFGGCETEPYSEGLQPQDFTEEEALEKMAEFYVVNMQIFSKYDGFGLRLIESEKLGCDSCYVFYFQFDSEHLDLVEQNVVGYQVNVGVVNGEVEDVQALEVVHDVALVLNISCSGDLDCRVPYDYALSSVCSYESHCMANKCTVVCPSFNGVISHESYDEWQLKAVEVAKNYIATVESFHKFSGRNIEVRSIEPLKCVGCYDVALVYEMDFKENESEVVVASAKLQIRDWSVVGSELSEAENEEWTYEKILFIAQGSDCPSEGILSKNYYYDDDIRKWWIEIDTGKGLCNPVCVVDEVVRSAEVSYRC